MLITGELFSSFNRSSAINRAFISFVPILEVSVANANVNVNVRVQDGAELEYSRSFDYEGIIDVQAEIPALSSVRVPLVDRPLSSMHFLVLESTLYSGITYRVNDGVGNLYTLDEVAAFIGSGMLGLFDSIPNQLYFYNSGEAAVTVSVLLAYDTVEEDSNSSASSSSASSDSSISSESSESSASSSSVSIGGGGGF